MVLGTIVLKCSHHSGSGLKGKLFALALPFFTGRISGFLGFLTSNQRRQLVLSIEASHRFFFWWKHATISEISIVQSLPFNSQPLMGPGAMGFESCTFWIEN